MGWYTYCTAELCFSKETFNSKNEVLEAIDSVKKEISHAEKKLIKLKSDQEKQGSLVDESSDYVRAIEDVLEEIKDCTIDMYRLEILYENFNTRQGDFIVYDKYYKCIKDMSPFFVKDKVYPANISNPKSDEPVFIVFNDNYEPVTIEKDYMKELFTETAKEDFDKF